MFGPFVDKTDGVTLKTDATTITDIDHATTGIFLSKNGAASAIRHQSVTASVADSYGQMQVTLDATDTGTAGRLDMIFAKAATYLPVQKTFNVLPQAEYDIKYAAGVRPVNLTQILGAAITGTAANIVAAFTKFFDKTSPTGTINSLPDAVAGQANGIAIVGSVMGKSPATLAAADVSGNLPAQVKAQDNIDFGVLQKLSLNAATPASIQSYGTLVADIVAAVWGALTSGMITLNSIGKKLADWVVGTLTSDYDAAKNAASQTSVNAITTNTARGRSSVPDQIFREAAGTQSYEFDLLIYSLKGVLEAPDAAPTIHARNGAGSSLDAMLSSTTMTLISTGKYKVTFNVAPTDILQEVLLDFSWAVGGEAFAVTDYVYVVDLYAVDFTSDDRTKLTDIHDKLPSGTIAKPGDSMVASNMRGTDDAALASVCTETRLAELDAANLPTDIAAIPTTKTEYSLSTAGITAIWASVIEGTVTVNKALKYILAVLVGKASGGGTTTITFKDTTDTTSRVVATVDPDGNRTNVTLDGS